MKRWFLGLSLGALCLLKVGHSQAPLPTLTEKTFTQTVRSLFFEQKYQAGLDYLRALKSKSKTPLGEGSLNLPIDRYVSIFYSYCIKQAFEGKNMLKTIGLMTKAKRFNEALLEGHPHRPVALVGIGENFQYKPGLLGGSLGKAELISKGD